MAQTRHNRRGQPVTPTAPRRGGPVAPADAGGHARHAGRVRPLTTGGTWVQVDGRPVCATCGRGLAPTGVDRWRHAPEGSGPLRRSRWLAPITPADALRLATYEDFARRYPWAATPGFAGPVVTTEADWQEGRERLRRYVDALAAARRRPLAPGDNPYLDLFRLLSAPGGEPEPAGPRAAPAPGADWPLTDGLAQMLHLRERRRELAALFSWAVPTAEALDLVADHAPLVECGAGSGYWSALLRLLGADIVSYDLAPPDQGRNEFHERGRAPWTEVLALDSVAAARRHGDRALFLCFPPYGRDDASYETLRAYTGDMLVYAGEGPGGSTGSVRFHRELALNWTRTEALLLPRWPLLRDMLAVYRRNGRRRPLRERDRCGECGRFTRTGWIGRCDTCFERRPPAVALRAGEHRVEYSREVYEALPEALRRALERSPNRLA